jgi:hypothetical protein
LRRDAPGQQRGQRAEERAGQQDDLECSHKHPPFSGLFVNEPGNRRTACSSGRQQRS